jgi:hypothetical protein
MICEGSGRWANTYGLSRAQCPVCHHFIFAPHGVIRRHENKEVKS